MKAVFTDNVVLRAAATAADWASHPVFQLERNEGRLRIVGSDYFVLVSGEVHAEFEGWDEGAKARLDPHDGSLFGLRRALKHARGNVNEVVVEEGVATIRVDSVTEVVKVTFRHDEAKPVDMERLDPTCELEPQGGSFLSAGKIEQVSDLANILAPPSCGWHVEPHGKNTLACFKMDALHDDGRNIRIMAMPLGEGKA